MHVNDLLLGLAQAEGGFWDSLKENFGWLQLAQIVGTLFLAFIVAWVFKHFVLTRFEKMAEQTDNDVDDRLVYFVARFYKGIVAFIVLVVVLRILKVEITPLLAGAGIVGIGVAYAARDIIGNFLAGVTLLVDRPIKIGDRIQIDRIGSQWGSWGDVTDVGLRTTTVRNTDGVYVTYPNAKLSESIIKNFTHTEDPVRFRLRVLVDLDGDLEHALHVLEEVGQADPDVLDEPAPNAVIRSFFDEDGGHLHYGALLELRSYVADIRARTRLRSRLLLAVQKAFEKEGIAFSRPHLTLTQERAAA